jgi:ribonuclease R
MVNEEKLLEFVRSESYRQMKTEELARHFSVGQSEMDDLVALLADLERRGQLVKVKKSHWVNPVAAGLVTGRLQCNPRGFGFVVPLDEKTQDVYVAEEDMGEAMHGDLVVVEVHRRRARGRQLRRSLGPSGTVIKVLEHRSRQVIGCFEPGGKFGRVVPDNPRLFRDIYVAREDWGGARQGDEVLVEVTAWPSLHRNPEGEVREVLGKAGAPGVDVRSVILEFGLPREFSQEAMRAARALRGSPTPEQVRSREDMRNHTTVTIDPKDAKDFDDALSLYRDPRTGLRVALVHIADISSHVPPDSPLDREARSRGCSVYLANEVVPMLPHEQSKHVLSLVAGEDRLAKTVIMQFDDSAAMVDYAICHSVVRVARQMTYTEVQKVLDALDSDEPAAASAIKELPREVVTLLKDLDELAGRLRNRRREVGSVDLDMPEYEVSMDESGRVVGVSQLLRDRSHGLVEEFMLCANQAVADFMHRKKLPALYRTHDAPVEEDLEEFADFIRAVLGRRVDPLDRKQLQALLAQVAGTHLAEAVSMQLLRAMQRALYSPQCRPHFALHFDRYCHFTSPVRRYPDLLVHQILDQFLARRVGTARLRAAWKGRLQPIASHCNEMEERADEAEREIVKVKLLRYLEQHRDLVFEAVVTGVQEYGLFARLEDYSVEGLIKVKDIGDDFFRFDEKSKALVGTRTGRTFRIGQPLKVTISAIDMARRELDLLLHEE